MPCASNSTRRARPLLGTFVEITVAEPPSPGLEALIDCAFDDVGKVHDLMSFQAPDSDVSRLNRDAGHKAVEVHAWTLEVLAAAGDLHSRSNGMFDITVAPVLQRLGWLPASPRVRPARSPPSDARGIRLLTGNRVQFSGPDVTVDLGGIAKGYAVDRALDHLRQAGVTAACVNAGGDLASFGHEGAPVAIRDPRDPRRSLGGSLGGNLASIVVRNGALASSGRTYDPVESGATSDCAVIDPARGVPVTAYAGASVCAETCMTADALTKVVLLMGEQAAETLEYYRASAMLVAATGDISVTSNWPSVVPRAI